MNKFYLLDKLLPENKTPQWSYLPVCCIPDTPLE
jgi:hypothetical protein